MKDLADHVDADSGRTPSDDEKTVGVDGTYGELPPDPDAHLSDEERARIVSPSQVLGLGFQSWREVSDRPNRTGNFSGNST